MAQAKPGLRWLRILIGGLAAYAATFVTIILIVTGYAFKLAFEARGEPDRVMIEEFAQSIAPTWGTGILGILTLLAAWLVARKAGSGHLLHGLLVGLVAGLPDIAIGFPPSGADIVSVVVALVSGTLGGALAGRGRAPAESEST